MGRLFGTDGARGIANTDLTCELATQLGRAAAMVLTKQIQPAPSGAHRQGYPGLFRYAGGGYGGGPVHQWAPDVVTLGRGAHTGGGIPGGEV